MKERIPGRWWRTIPLIAAVIGIACGGSNPSSVLFEEHFESYSENSVLVGAVWSDPIYENCGNPSGNPSWAVVKDADHPERSQVALNQHCWGSAIAGDGGWTNYKVSALVKPAGGYTGIVARYQDTSHFYVLTLRASYSKLELTKGVGTAVLAGTDQVVDPSTYYKLSMELNGAVISCFMNDELRFSYTDPSPVTGGKTTCW
jgi:hypothetical protein